MGVLLIHLGINLELGSSTAGMVNLNTGSTLNNNAVLSIASGHTQINSGTLNNNGALTNLGQLTNDLGGALTNNGALTNAAELNNIGTLTNSFDGNMSNYGTLTNEGTLTINGTLNNFITFIQTAGSNIVNGTISGVGTLDYQGGSLSGSGTIAASKITIGEEATVKPGNSSGTLIMISDVELSGTLETEIYSNSLFDVLEVQGNVKLSDKSAFDFLFDEHFTPTVGDSFDFLSAFTFDFGSFNDFENWFNLANFSVTNLATDFAWSVSYTVSLQDQTPHYLSLNIIADGSVVNPNPVSGPGTLGLFFLSLALIGWGSRRAKRCETNKRNKKSQNLRGEPAGSGS
jgi:hypothetical protein